MSKVAAGRIWEIVHDERARLVHDLTELGVADWQVPSLCPGWSVHDTLAHLVDSARTTRLSFVRRMLAAGFDFDKDNANGVRREKRSNAADTLSAMQRAISLTSTPPAALATRLVEAFVHGEDIRRPLGLAGMYPLDGVVAALDYQLATSVSMGGGKQRAERVRLVATDVDYSAGSGPDVSGSALDLLLAVSGRPVVDGQLSRPLSMRP